MSGSAAPAGVATPVRKPSPSMLMVSPALRPSPSSSNIQFDGQEPPSSSSHSKAPDSSSSSVSNLNINENLLIQDAEVEVETNDEDAAGSMDRPANSEISKKSLRDKLRRTLSETESGADTVASRLGRKSSQVLENEISYDSDVQFAPRQYFILTDAGKPVFTSPPSGEDSGNIASTIGVMQALISVFIDDDDKLRCINAGNTRITFLIRSPLYFVCVSSWGEPESITRSHLEYLHLQILSIVTASQLRRIFERHTNFDLRRLLDGAETFLTSLLIQLESDLALSTSSLHVLRLDANLRKQAADALVPTSKMKDILYVMLVARGRVVTLIRPRKHSIHPADIHILLNTIHAPSILNSPASVSWIPVCLPKYNPTGFLNAYISFLGKDDEAHKQDPNSSGATGTKPRGDEHKIHHEKASEVNQQDAGVALVYIGGGEFETTRTWCDSAAKKLESEGVLKAIINACREGPTEYTASELGIPGLWHFVYKSRAQVQVTLPIFEDPYDDINARRRVTTLYQIIHDAIHKKSGQDGPLKLQYIRTEKESVMGWITQPFELYVALSPRLPKSAVVGAANAVARWVKKEEARLFLKDAPVF